MRRMPILAYLVGEAPSTILLARPSQPPPVSLAALIIITMKAWLLPDWYYLGPFQRLADENTRLSQLYRGFGNFRSHPAAGRCARSPRERSRSGSGRRCHEC